MMPLVSKPTSPGNVRAIQYTARELLNIQGVLGNTAKSAGQTIPSLLRLRSTGRTEQRQALRLESLTIPQSPASTSLKMAEAARRPASSSK